MSEQSGPITREQVERLIDDMHEDHGMWHVIADALGEDWLSAVPMDVRLAWQRGEWGACIAALTRWRDELAAAEPVRRVARWDAYALAYAAKNADGAVHYYQNADRAKADGYEIEGGPEPIQPAEDSPERLRERREAREVSLVDTDAAAGRAATQMASWPTWKRALSERVSPADSPGCLQSRREELRLSRHEAAALVNRSQSGSHCWTADDVQGCEDGPVGTVWSEAYAAALSAEEARRAADGADRVIAAIGRPAPRFKVGDLDPALRETALAATRMLRCGKWPLSLPRVRELPGFDAWNSGPLTSTDWIAQLEALLAEPASPPAPEVVDVPQPAPLPKTLAHFYTIRALPEPHRVSWNMPTDGPQWVRVSDALWLHVDDLRAMLADIDAQQGGAS